MILLVIIALIVIVAVVLVLVLKNHKESAPKSASSWESFATASSASYDPALQYNIVDHPVRQRIMREAALGNPPAEPTHEQIEGVRKQLNDWYRAAEKAGKLKPMDQWAKISVDAALDSASMGNWPIGNVICYMPEGTEKDPSQWVEILRGGNRFFTRNPHDILATTGAIPRMDSHAHGEMVVLDAFEDRLTRGFYDKSSSNYSLPADSPIDFRKRNDLVGYGMPDNIVLFTQLASCEMCLSRVGNSGIARCYFLAPDNAGSRHNQLCYTTPAYFNMLNRQVHGVAEASMELIQFAFLAFAGPSGAFVSYCTWKLGQIGAPKNITADYGYCPGQYYANKSLGENAVYDAQGFFRTVTMAAGESLNCSVKTN
jgi:tRNA(Arg) A34 adenosine deaminase TadA